MSAFALYLTVIVTNLLGRGHPALHLHFFTAPGLAGVEGLLVTVTALGIVNAVLRPLVKALTLPLTCLTLGLFSFVINALLFWLSCQIVPHKFRVEGWQTPLFGSLAMGFVGGLLNNILVSKREKR